MKYILICLQDDNNIGGAEMVLRMIVKRFLSNGYGVNVFFKHKRKYGGWDMANTPNLHLFYSKSSRARYGTFLCLLQMLRTRNTNYEYAFTSLTSDTGITGLMRKLHLVKIKYFVARESTSIFKRFTGLELFRFKMFYHLGYSAVDLLICQTSFMKEQLLENLPWLEKKTNVQIIPNPVDLKKMAEKTKEELPMPTNVPFIVSCGRFHPVKGFDILVNAFAEFKLSYKEFKLVILGRLDNVYKNGVYGDEVKVLIKSLGLEDDVILQGVVDNVYPYFKAAKMCVVPSRIEGFPNVLLQEMSQNEKVVSTLCAGDIDKLDGIFTCRPNDEDDLLRAMKECIEADTSKNRVLFDRELQRRSIDRFIELIETYKNGKIIDHKH
jgi:glycosyltransferase involved in cell wall biosynthesis